MDETAISVDMPDNNTIEQRVAKTLPVKSTGHEKMRATVCFSACANGRQLKPLNEFKGEICPQKLRGIPIEVIEMSSNAGFIRKQQEFG